MTELVPMSDIQAVVDGTVEVRSIEKRLRSNVSSATRSDRLAAELFRFGLGPERIALKLDEMLEAKMLRKRTEWNSDKQKWEPTEVEEPDYKAQAQAVKFLCDIHGFLFQLPKDVPVTINNVTLGIAQDVEKMTVSQLLAELPGAVRMLKELDPQVMAAIEDAEIEDV